MTPTGRTHKFTEGDYTTDVWREINSAITEAVIAEREECAKVAKGFSDDCRTTTAYRLAVVSIVAAIRARGNE